MKRSCYFISARSASADILGSELILALYDQFPKIDCVGILGEWSGRTRATRVGDLASLLKQEVHEKPQDSDAAKALSGEILRQIEQADPQLAILVGYSALHHMLAGFFHSRSIPVVLYEMTPSNALVNIDSTEIAQRITTALGISPRGSQLVQMSGVPYVFIGSPHKDRVDRVLVEASSLGIDNSRPVISVFPGTRSEGSTCTFPTFQQLAERLSQEPGLQVILSATEALLQDRSLTLLGRPLAEYVGQHGTIRVLSNMNLELLSLSTLAITGPGAVTIECSLFEVPLLPIFPGPASESPKTLVNQTVGKTVVEEFSADTPSAQLFEHAKALIGPSPKREATLLALQDVKLSLQGFAAENAADYIGREIGQWKQRKRGKGSKSA